MSLKWHGDEVAKIFEDANEMGIVAVCMAVEREAVRMCPVDTGRLRGSITYRTKNSRDAVSGTAKADDGIQTQPGKYEGLIGTNVNYAAHVEYGTKRMAPRKFLRGGADAVMDKADAIFTKGFQQVIKKVKN